MYNVRKKPARLKRTKSKQVKIQRSDKNPRELIYISRAELVAKTTREVADLKSSSENEELNEDFFTGLFENGGKEKNIRLVLFYRLNICILDCLIF